MTSTSLFKWTSEFSVGIQEIDDQHKMLFELINRLFLAAVNRAGQPAVAEILDALVDYTRTHFLLEEELMAAAGYAGLDQHRGEHRRFVEKLEAVVKKFLVEEKTVTFELINFLKKWLKEHIQETDMAYAKSLAKANYSTEKWARSAHSVAAGKDAGNQQKPWWKFWSDPSGQQTG